MPKCIYTIGHSTRSIDDFMALLKSHEITLLVDVRTIPKSRHNPQFNADALKAVLEASDMRYKHLPQLGGLRHTTADSINTGWHNPSFRGFADYMQTPSFWQGIEMLEALGETDRCVIMCAEVVPWRCHRSLIADALTLRKWQVIHIISEKSCKLHELTAFLHVKQGRLVYKGS